MQSLATKLKNPGSVWDGSLTSTDFNSEIQQHIAFVAVSTFAARHSNNFPRANHAGDAADVVLIAKALVADKTVDVEDVVVDDALVTRLAVHAAVELQPMAAFIGMPFFLLLKKTPLTPLFFHHFLFRTHQTSQ